MKLKKEAENELRNYIKMENVIKHNTEMIYVIDQDMIALRSVKLDGSPVSGGTSTREDWLIDKISKKDKLELMINIAKKQLELIERGLLTLTEEEQKILRYFYVDRPKDYIDRLCDELGYEQSSLYYHKDIALRKYTLAVYGVIDT